MNIGDLTFAKKVTNYAVNATVATAWWISTTVYRAIVPAGKRWFVFGGSFNKDVSSTVTVAIYSKTPTLEQQLDVQAAAQYVGTWPSTVSTVAIQQRPPFWVLDAGEYVQLTFGTAQGAGAYATCMALEVTV